MNDVQSGDGAGLQNPDLEAMHRDLVGLVRRLELSIDAAPTIAAIEAIAQQIAEINARVTATGRVLLARQTEEIARHASAVADTIPLIEKQIDDVQDCEQMVRSVTALLGAVDDAVRIAALACP